MRFVFGIFIVLHGLVHLLYFGQSARYFELKPGMVWPDGGSWTFSKLLGNEAARNLASILLILAALGFIVGGAGLLVNQAWWRPVVVSGAAFSLLVYITFGSVILDMSFEDWVAAYHRDWKADRREPRFAFGHRSKA